LTVAVASSRPPLPVPGLKPVDPRSESYWVRPGGATVIPVAGDDRLTVIDPDGGQPAEVTVLAPDGRHDAAALGVAEDGPATVLRALLGRDGAGHGAPAAGGFLADLHARGLRPHDALAVAIFGPDSRPGASQAFLAQRDTVVVVAAPGGRVIDGDPPSSALIVEVRRALARPAVEVELPPPLAEPRLDFRIDRASALSYEVQEGEYIQIIDVQGRQCSDFLAFDARRLHEGVERGLDATVTRTLMGNAYPTPGLKGKYYDLDMHPLCEVVQDTVGRHDTFALACTSKYYEDLGYFGHINCSDNFNGQLERYEVEPRKGWPALNFFYNTAFDNELQLGLDEPWSRPGDYVMLRAARDLVCASSACPDDIDPANGWECTDVHVRVYPKRNRFSMAIAHRVTPEAEPVMTKETGFHPRTSALTQSFVEYRGYWLPHCYDNEGPIAEYWACREKAVVMDLSPLRKWEVLGPDAEQLVQRAVTRDARRLAVGQVVYTAVCNETGGMLDDATVFRMGDDNFRFIGGDEYDGVWLKQLAEREGLRAWVKPSTDQLHNVAVQGPQSREILKQVVWTPKTQTRLADLKWFRFLVGRIGDYDGIPIVVSRTGYTGELGYEVFCHPDDAPAVWDAIWEAGRGHGLKPLGLEALDMIRIEAGLIFAGYEFDDQVDPFEAGIGFSVRLDSEDDFVGKDALVERKDHPQRTLVGLELEGNETAGHGDCVHVGRSQVGVVTSGTRSPVLRKNIALCRMAVQYAELGTEVEVGKLDGHQKRIPATVVRVPFYDPDKTRPRS
jgi:glycine cleavage system T protein (aminomethyltransferase)